MRYLRSRLPIAIAALTLLAACAGVPQQQPGGDLPARARYMAYAGAPIDHFNWMGRIDGWEALSDDELIVFVGANGAYYLKVWSPCGTVGLRFVNRIEITRSIVGTVYTRLDSIRADRWSCPISEIRPSTNSPCSAEIPETSGQTGSRHRAIPVVRSPKSVRRVTNVSIRRSSSC